MNTAALVYIVLSMFGRTTVAEKTAIEQYVGTRSCAVNDGACVATVIEGSKTVMKEIRKEAREAKKAAKGK